MPKIMHYRYKTACEMYPCTRPAQYSIGNPGEPSSTFVNVCGKCLQKLADEMPIQMIKDRLKKPCKQCHMSQVKINTQVELDSFSVRDLRDMARKIDMKGYSSMTKDELIAELTRKVR